MPTNILNLPAFSVTAVLPDATIVIDKFHVVRMANDAMGYGLPPGHFGKALLTLRKNAPKPNHPHKPPGPPKNYGADINTLIELLESGRL